MKRFPMLVLFSFLIVACAASPEARATETSVAATSTASAWTLTPTPTNTLTPTITPSPTNTATPTPTTTPIGGKDGVLAFVSEKTYIINLSLEEIITTIPSPKDINRAALKWAPDAQRLLFTSGDDEVSLNVFNMVDGTITELRTGVGYVENIVWSSDGKWIAYENRGSNGGSPWIWTVNVETQKSYPIGSGCYPEWSIDGTRLYFRKVSGGCWIDIIFYTNPTGYNKTQFSLPKKEIWSKLSANFRWAKPSLGFMLATRDRNVGVSPAELLTVSPDGTTGQIIFRFPEDWPEDKQGYQGFQISPEQEWMIIQGWRDAREQGYDWLFAYWLVHIPDGSIRDLNRTGLIQPIGWTSDEQNVLLLVAGGNGSNFLEIIDAKTGDKVFSYQLPDRFRLGYSYNVQGIDVGWSSSPLPGNWAGTTFRPFDPNEPPLDIARYDNFDEVLFDGAFNKKLWHYWDDTYEAGFTQEDGYLEVLSDESAALVALHHADFVISTPSYYEARIKLSKVTDGYIALKLHGDFADGTWWAPLCGISGNEDNDQPWIFWSNSKRGDEASYARIFVDYDSWHTIRIEMNPNDSSITFLIDGIIVGSIQEDEFDKAKFSLVLETGMSRGSINGYIDYVDFGDLE